MTTDNLQGKDLTNVLTEAYQHNMEFLTILEKIATDTGGVLMDDGAVLHTCCNHGWHYYFRRHKTGTLFYPLVENAMMEEYGPRFEEEMASCGVYLVQWVNSKAPDNGGKVWMIRKQLTPTSAKYRAIGSFRIVTAASPIKELQKLLVGINIPFDCLKPNGTPAVSCTILATLRHILEVSTPSVFMTYPERLVDIATLISTITLGRNESKSLAMDIKQTQRSFIKNYVWMFGVYGADVTRLLLKLVFKTEPEGPEVSAAVHQGQLTMQRIYKSDAFMGSSDDVVRYVQKFIL